MTFRNCIAVLAITSLFVSQVQGVAAQDWKETKSTEGKFKVLMPGESKYYSQDLTAGKGKSHRFFVETDHGNVQYQVTFHDMPEDYVRNTGSKAILDSTQDNSPKRIIKNAVTKKHSDIELAANPGREFYFTGSDVDKTIYFYWRVYMVKNRLYQLGVVGVGTPVSEEATRRFFDSFKLL